MRKYAAILLVLSGTLSAAESNKAIATVSVSAPLRDGFVDTSKEIQDSVNDIRRRLSKMKEFRVVESPSEADLVLIVVARGVGSETFGQRISYSENGGAYYRNAQLTSIPIVAQTLWVSAMMEIGGYRKEFTGTAKNMPGVRWGRWSECADHLAKDLKSWAVANRDQIKLHRH